MCDGSSAGKWSCSPLSGTTPVFNDGVCVAVEAENWRCEDSNFTIPRDVADEAREYVDALGTEYLEGLGGTEGRIDILINVDHDEFSGNEAGLWRSRDGAILIRKPFFHSESGELIRPAEDSALTAHELFHAVTVGHGKIEHGLVPSVIFPRSTPIVIRCRRCKRWCRGSIPARNQTRYGLRSFRKLEDLHPSGSVLLPPSLTSIELSS